MDIMRIPPEELGIGSSIRLERCNTEHDIYWKMAIEMVELIAKNNAVGKTTFMVIPYGPLGSFNILVYLINKYRVSLKNCVFINMDEYLKDDGSYIDTSDALSFRGGMDRIFYGLIDEELNVLPENRYFPDPANPGQVLELMGKYGKFDMTWGGIGINGHFAFNEPPEPDEECTNEEFLERPTRILPISRETRTINAYMNCGANLEAIPKLCITVGMKEIWQSERIRILMPRDWLAAMLRRVLHGEITCRVPCSLFRNHPDCMVYACNDAIYGDVIPKIRVYNKK
ncbi:MAG: glucosamine-6-phosphate isomerase [Clostridiales bacterium]|nr:glucosamine-6-phosphate isomerase [Clostridiales bacterium]